MLVSTLFTIAVLIFIITLTVLDIIKKRKDQNGLLWLNPDYHPAYKTILTILYIIATIYIIVSGVLYLIDNWNNTIQL
jgi:amino acid transporter